MRFVGAFSADGRRVGQSAIRVLVVDDEPSIRMVVDQFLSVAGYEVDVAEDAHTAKELLGAFAYDVVVSDIKMPGLSGVDLLKEIRQSVPDVQVILMTGEPTVATAAEAVRSGASDYLSKPVSKDAILRSVGQAARIKRLEDERRRLERENEAYRVELEARNQQLDALVCEKSRQLASAHDRLALADQTKSEFLQLLSHELRTPANGVLGIADMVFDCCPEHPDVRTLRALFEKARQRMLDTLEGALLLAQIQTSREKFHPTSVSLGDALAYASCEAAKLGHKEGVDIVFRPSACSVAVLGDPALFRRALSSLLETAVAFTEKGKSVTVRCSETDATVTLTMSGSGRRLAPGLADRFFEVFSTVRQVSPAEALGLKPAVAERIVSLFGGQVRIASVEPAGVDLTVVLPRAGSNG